MPGVGVTRASIYRAALRLFAEKGYLATTMADIGGALGIKGPSLYKHVTAKQELLYDVIVETMTNLLERRREIVSTVDDPVEQLRLAVRDHTWYSAKNPYETFVGTRELHHLYPENREAIIKLRTEFADLLQEIIDQGVAEGVFEVRSSRMTTFMIIDMVIGMPVWFRPGQDLSLEEIADFYAEHALLIAGCMSHVNSPVMRGTSPTAAGAT